MSATFVSNALLSPVKLPSEVLSSSLKSNVPPNIKGSGRASVAATKMAEADDIRSHRKLAVNVVLEKAFITLKEWSESYILSNPSPGEDGDQDLFFNVDSAHPIACLGHRIHFPGIRRYTVSFKPISVHLPLHRFISKIIDFAAAANIEFSHSVSMLTPTNAFTFADYPLRCLSFCAQVQSGMWRRNGSTAANLAYNYERPPLCKSLRNTDLTAIQTSMLVLGPNSILALIIDRYELSLFLEKTCLGVATEETDKLAEYKGPLLADMLRTIILLTTYLPAILVDNTDSKQKEEKDMNIQFALKRELSHLLLSGD